MNDVILNPMEVRIFVTKDQLSVIIYTHSILYKTTKVIQQVAEEPSGTEMKSRTSWLVSRNPIFLLG